MPRVDEINRLIALGLRISTAIGVADGYLNEAFEIAREQEKQKVADWCKNRSNLSTHLSAHWDCDPANIYLTSDGANPRDYTPEDFVIVDADIAEVDQLLTHNASRNRGPWCKDYKQKSYGIAYRWEQGLGVTPPLIIKVKNEIHIEGGMHRFHLAKHYGELRMPFLVRVTELADIIELLKSAMSRAILP